MNHDLLTRARRAARKLTQPRKKRFLPTLALAGALLFGGYPAAAAERIPQPVVSAHAQTPIFMYHNIGKKEGRFTVQPETLYQHIEQIEDAGYDFVTFSEFAERDFSRITNKPAVLTFDDSTVNQYRILPSGITDPNSAVGVLEQYKRDHPQTTLTATFFVNTTTENNLPVFGQPGLAQTKCRFLTRNGYEIGAHADRHRDFNDLTKYEIAADLATFTKKMRDHLPEYQIRSFAYPYGSLPGKDSQEIVERRFPHTAHAWGGVATNEERNIPRIEIGPDTEVNQYLTDNNVYKGNGTRISHARSNPQLQARTSQTDAKSDDRLSGQRRFQRESSQARWKDSNVQHRQQEHQRRSTISTRQFWRDQSTLRDRNAWTSNRQTSGPQVGADPPNYSSVTVSYTPREKLVPWYDVELKRSGVSKILEKRKKRSVFG